jgi:N-acetylmuramoyl-L-alanine amidase
MRAQLHSLCGPSIGLLVTLLMWQSTQAVQSEPARAGASDRKCNAAQFRVLVDVGHTAEKVGARSARGVGEYEFNLRLAGEIEQGLKDAGFTRTRLLIVSGPALASLAKRVARANAWPADLFLSIHHDSVPDALLERWEHEGQERGFSDRFSGHSLFISIDNSDVAGSLHFARLLGRQLKTRGLQYTPHYTNKIMGNRQRILVDKEAGVYRYDQLIVLRGTHMPAVLLEAGSIINRDEEVKLNTPEHRALISAAAVDAISEFCAARAARRTTPQPRPNDAPRKHGGTGDPLRNHVGVRQRAPDVEHRLASEIERAVDGMRRAQHEQIAARDHLLEREQLGVGGDERIGGQHRLGVGRQRLLELVAQ